MKLLMVLKAVVRMVVIGREQQQTSDGNISKGLRSFQH
jgi:hypothetical protein